MRVAEDVLEEIPWPHASSTSIVTPPFCFRRIEQSTHENVAVRLLTADPHPDHDTICTFRRENQALFSESFVKVLELAVIGLAGTGPASVSGSVMPLAY